MSSQLVDATVIVNDTTVGVVPNSVAFTEGLGEQSILPVSVGNGATEQVFSHDLETAYSMFKFQLRTTPENIDLAKSWKQNRNRNVVQIAGTTPEGDLTRTFTQASLTADYEIPLGTDSVIDIEFQANKGI